MGRRRNEASGHRMTRNGDALGVLLLPCVTTAFSLIAMRGQTVPRRPHTTMTQEHRAYAGHPCRRVVVRNTEHIFAHEDTGHAQQEHHP